MSERGPCHRTLLAMITSRIVVYAIEHYQTQPQESYTKPT